MIHDPITYLASENFYYLAESLRMFVRHFEYIHHNKELVAERMKIVRIAFVLSCVAVKDSVTILEAWLCMSV
jgi:hypothetical protein